jgi:hypothetical protein
LRANDTLNFPEFLTVSKNYFQMEWVLLRTTRRIKNVIVVMEWNPAVSASFAPSSKFGLPVPITAEQEVPMRRCFDMFDLKRKGKLNLQEITKVCLM